MVTNFPLIDILHNRDATGRISKWAVELGALSLEFKPHTTIKFQALANFTAEWWENQVPTPTECLEHWVMYFDGSLKLEGAGAGVLLISPKGSNSNTSCRSSGRCPIIKPNVRLYYMGCT